MDARLLMKFRQPLCWFLILQYSTELCLCAHHYCVNGHPMNIRIGGSYHMDETIIPDIPDEPIYKRGNYKRCNWEITVDETGNHNSQILLEGVNLETVDFSGSSNKTQVNILLNRNENVTLGMFQVKPLSQRKHISVQINWDPKTQSRSPVNLRILIPVAGVCSRDMLSFNGSCHAITTVPANITGAVEHCSGDAMLASFTNMAQIIEFIAANEARQNELPYKSPLDLSEWVRLGMFYRAGDDAILSVVRTQSDCELIKVDKNLFQVSEMQGPCGAFKVNEFGKAVLRFGDCYEGMLSLVSFPETAKSALSCPLNCSKHLLYEISLLREVFKSTMTMAPTTCSSTATVNHKYNETIKGEINDKLSLILILFGSLVPIGLVPGLVGVIIFTRRKKSLKSDQASRSEKRVQISSRLNVTLAEPLISTKI